MESAIRHYGDLFARTPTATTGLNGIPEGQGSAESIAVSEPLADTESLL
jgi:hypothetical protein